MYWALILIVISLIINGIIIYLLRNSHNYHNEPIKFPLIVWICIGILTCIPIVNSMGSIMFIVSIIVNYSGGDIEFNNDFWLAKEY